MPKTLTIADLPKSDLVKILDGLLVFPMPQKWLAELIAANKLGKAGELFESAQRLEEKAKKARGFKKAAKLKHAAAKKARSAWRMYVSAKMLNDDYGLNMPAFNAVEKAIKEADDGRIQGKHSAAGG